MTAYTPHYDELAIGDPDCRWELFLVGHYIEEDYDPRPDYVVSGFDRGREELAHVLLEDPETPANFTQDHHLYIETTFWDNTHVQRQCNGNQSYSKALSTTSGCAR